MYIKVGVGESGWRGEGEGGGWWGLWEAEGSGGRVVCWAFIRGAR